MSQENLLTQSDIEILTNLLLRSQQSRSREGLCLRIGIDPQQFSFIRDSSDYDFYLQLITYLNAIDEQEALCKLSQELFQVFHHGRYVSNLRDISAKLNCNQEFSQNSPNNKQSTVSSSIPAFRVSVNSLNELAKNKLIIDSEKLQKLDGAVVTLKCLGDVEGSRFLDGRTADGTVGLVSSTDERFTGTKWEISVWE